jgi:hypothetical protein
VEGLEHLPLIILLLLVVAVVVPLKPPKQAVVVLVDFVQLLQPQAVAVL